MSDEEQAVQRPAQTYQTPDWETPTNKRRSLFDRFPPIAFPHHRNPTAGDSFAKEASHSNQSASFVAPAAATTAATQKTQSSSLQAHFDAVFPPHKSYVGLSRKRFLLFILLPSAVILFLVLPLALGLGLSDRSGGRANLPLPGNKQVQTGDLTYYDVGLGACGEIHDDEDMVVSVSHYVWDDVQAGGNPNSNPLCGKKIRVRRDDEGSVDVTVVDRCTGCEPTDLDLSPAAFTRLANKDEGRVTGTWSWLD